MRDLDDRLADADPAAGSADALDERARADLAAILTSPPQPSAQTASSGTTPSRRPSPRLLALAATLVIIAGAGTAIAVSTSTPPAVSASTGAPDAGTLLGAFGGGSAGAAEIYATTTELAASSDLVATGTFVRFQPGRAEVRVSDGAPAEATSTVMVLAQSVIDQGQVAPGSDGFLYLEVPIDAEDSLSQQDAGAIPAGTQVLVYADTAWDGSTTVEGYRALDPLAGRPAGQPLYGIYKPQGITLQAAGDVVVWPALNRSASGTLDQALPGGDLIWTP